MIFVKFIVDELPYYDMYCPFVSKEKCYTFIMTNECPRHLNKNKVNSRKNLHECELLKEVSIYHES